MASLLVELPRALLLVWPSPASLLVELPRALLFVWPSPASLLVELRPPWLLAEVQRGQLLALLLRQVWVTVPLRLVAAEPLLRNAHQQSHELLPLR